MRHDLILSQFKLLGGILKPPDAKGQDLLVRLGEIVNKDIPEAFRKGGTTRAFELISDLQAVYEQFCSFILYDKLIGKSIIALGGGFSSGKSSFLNALDGEEALPTDINPSTAVPTFVVHAEKHEAMGVNIFDAKMPIGLRDIRAISHGFGEIRNDKGEVEFEAVTLGHVLKSIFLASPKQRYNNLAFVDTPGFSKPDSDYYSAKTDAVISRGQLNSSNYIIMFVPADAGTLKDEDLRFIQSLRGDIPKLFIISKAEMKSASALSDITAHIKSQLTLGGIAYIDVLTFSRNEPDGYDSHAIRDLLSRWNNTPAMPDFARNFKQLFIESRSYYEKTIDDERRRREHINRTLTLISGEDSDVKKPLESLLREITAKIKEQEEALEELKSLKNSLFTELNRIGRKIGIGMPEPSEFDMSDDTVDVLGLLSAYKAKNGISSKGRTAAILRDAFYGITPKLDAAAGGSAQRNAIYELIKTLGAVQEVQGGGIQ